MSVSSDSLRAVEVRPMDANCASISFMRKLEDQYQKTSGLVDRRDYKIFYSPIRRADILTLGDNPGGDPNVIPPGAPGTSASTGSFEKNEHDLLDCRWPENNVLKLLIPLLGGFREEIRERVVKTNLAFRRSPTKKSLAFGMSRAMDEAAPFLDQIITAVQPRLVHLSGPNVAEFVSRYASESSCLVEPVRDAAVNKTVFSAVRVRMRSAGLDLLVVQTAHASQFSWTYDKYNVAARIRQLGFV